MLADSLVVTFSTAPDAQLYRAIMTRGPGVSKAVAEDNAAFLRSFAHDDMQPKVPLSDRLLPCSPIGA
jgi:hypothetical protein